MKLKTNSLEVLTAKFNATFKAIEKHIVEAESYNDNVRYSPNDVKKRFKIALDALNEDVQRLSRDIVQMKLDQGKKRQQQQQNAPLEGQVV